MSFEVIEVSLDAIEFDPSDAYSDKDGFVYLDLKRYLARYSLLPAIFVELRDNQFFVTRGHKYVSIAREFGHQRIRAIIFGVRIHELRNVKGFIRTISREQLDAEDKQHEVCNGLVDAWHVLFFKHPPQGPKIDKIIQKFETFIKASVQQYCSELDIEFVFDPAGPCLELRFPTPPTENKKWSDDFLGLMVEISHTVCPISSYNGRRFEF